MIYLNQAGTSWPKPEAVLAAVNQALKLDPHSLNKEYQLSHQRVCEFFNFPQSEGFLFTTSCTGALDLSLTQLNWRAGDKIITSALEHHALSRCLTKLARERGVSILRAPYRQGSPLDLTWVETELKRGGVKLVAVCQASNVTGELLPVEELGPLSHLYGAWFLMDGAQTAGTLPLDVSRLAVDVFVFAGHKGTLGPQGLGGLYIHPGVELTVPAAQCDLKNTARGATPCSPTLSFCDTGSVNMAGVVGLAAGLKYITRRGLEAIRKENLIKASKLLEALRELPLELYGPLTAEDKTSVLSFNPKNKSPQQLLEELKRGDVFISHGFQCAPWAHEALGTSANGVFRVSPGCMNSMEEIDSFIEVITKAVR